MADAVHVRGLADLQRALAKADRETRLGVRADLRKAAEPVRSDAQQLAAVRIRNLGEGQPWSRMRTGITRRSVYVAPRQRGRGSRRRPKFGTLLMDRAMEPALEQNAAGIVHEVEQTLDRIADRFNRG